MKRAIRHTVAARVAAMEQEKMYLQDLHGELGRQWRSIGDRIASIDRQVAAEKASVLADKPIAAMSGPAMGPCPGCGCIQANGYVGGWFGWICGSQSTSHTGDKIQFKQSNACASMHWRLRAEKAEAKLREIESPNR
jgi:hypothetical protein